MRRIKWACQMLFNFSKLTTHFDNWLTSDMNLYYVFRSVILMQNWWWYSWIGVVLRADWIVLTDPPLYRELRKVGQEMWSHMSGAYASLNGRITEDQIFEGPHGPNKCWCSDRKNHITSSPADSKHLLLPAYHWDSNSFRLPSSTTYLTVLPPGARRPPVSSHQDE